MFVVQFYLFQIDAFDREKTINYVEIEASHINDDLNVHLVD